MLSRRESGRAMEVRPSLWVGGWKELEEGKDTWTHVLSVDGPHTHAKGKDSSVKRMCVNVLDLPSENLLQHLTRCLSFISRSLRSGEAEGGKKVAVLVHCHAGVSRSVAVVAAHLMRAEGLGLDEALEVIRRVNPDAEPNEGFREQLELYGQMGCRIDVNNPLYRHHLLKHQGRGALRPPPCAAQSTTPEARAAADASGSLSALSLEENGAEPGTTEGSAGRDGAANDEEKANGALLLCRKCRSVLARSCQIIPHAAPAPTRNSDGSVRLPRKWHVDRRKQRQATGGAHECSSVYLEPLKWMEEVESGANEGKLSCYKCKTRLGHFSWSGIQCSCMQWVTPAFQLHKSKIDVVRDG